jgi:hypothetical protein
MYFTSVVVAERDVAVLGGHLRSQGNEPTVTRVLVCSGGNWGYLFDFDEIAYGVTKKPSDTGTRPTYCLLGRDGHYREMVPRAAPADSYIGDGRDGFLLDLRYIGRSLYACGVQNQVFRQTDSGWVRMDKGIYAPLEERVDRMLHAIDGFAEDDIYAVGNGGAIWHFNGSLWARLESPTNYHLYSVVCAKDGNVYLGGAKGLVFVGSATSGWRDLSDPSITTSKLEDMTEFQEKIYITANTLLLSTSGQSLEVVDVPVEGVKSFYMIDSGLESMWSVGDDCVIQFNGSTWVRHVYPENE